MSAQPSPPSPMNVLERARARPELAPHTEHAEAVEKHAEPTTRPLRASDWAAVLALADELLSFPFDRLIRRTRDPSGWVLIDARGDLLLVQLTRVVEIGRERLGAMGWTLAAPRRSGPAPGRAYQHFFDRVHADMEAQGCTRLVVGDSDAYLSPSWRLAHAGGYRRWTPLQQIRALGWRWPAIFWRVPHFGVRTFVLQRPLQAKRSDARSLADPGGGPALLTALYLGGILMPLATGLGVWRGFPASESWLEAAGLGALAALLHLGWRASVTLVAARARGLRLGFRVWDSGLVVATLLAPLGVFAPGLSGAAYVRDELYDYAVDRAGFGSVRTLGIVSSSLLSAGAVLCLLLRGDAPALLSAIAMFGLWLGISDTLPGRGPWQALPVGAARRRHPHAARAFLLVWLVTLAAFALMR